MASVKCYFWVSLVAQLVKNLPVMQETQVRFLGREDRWRRERLPIPVFLSFPGGSAGKESVYNKGDLGSILRLGRSPGEGKGYPLQYSGLENSMDCSPWCCHESDTTEQLSLCKVSQRKKLTKIRVEINKIESKKTI